MRDLPENPQVEKGKQRKAYYRLLFLDYRLFERWLNLPEGFVVEDVFDLPERLGLTLRVRCPENEYYEVAEYSRIPEALGLCRTFVAEDGRCEAITYWPELGQLEPPNPFEVRIGNA